MNYEVVIRNSAKGDLKKTKEITFEATISSGSCCPQRRSIPANAIL